jgi:hypothetical protein
MKVVHWGMIFSGGGKSVYGTHTADCRWRNKALGQWVGRILDDTGARLTLDVDDWQVARDERRRKVLDDLARSEAARLNLPAGPDTFPFH